MLSERRAYPRSNVGLEVGWTGTAGYRHARISDLSVDGCYVESMSNALVGAILRFEIQLSEEEQLYLKGQVMHCAPSRGFGLRFVNLDESQLSRIRRVIATDAPTDDTATQSPD
jgi:hypothetical protein